jgi:hypothetical protein
MAKFGWKIALAAALAVVNLGISSSARADHLKVIVSGGSTTHRHTAAAGATSFTVPTSKLATHFPELTSRGGRSDVMMARHSLAMADRRALIVGGGHPRARAVRLHTTINHFFKGATSPAARAAVPGFASPTNVVAMSSGSTTVSTPAPGTFTPDSSGLSPFANGNATAANLNLTNPAGSLISNTAMFATNSPSEAGAAASLVFAADTPAPASIVLGAFALPLLVFLRRRRAAA